MHREATRAGARLLRRRGAGLQGGRCRGRRSRGPQRRVPPKVPATILGVRYLTTPRRARRRSRASSLTTSASRPSAKPHGRRRGSVTRSFPGSRRPEAIRRPPQMRAGWCRNTARRRYMARCRKTVRRRNRALCRATRSLSKARRHRAMRGSLGCPGKGPKTAGMRRIGALGPAAVTLRAERVTGPTFRRRAPVASRRSGRHRPNPGTARRRQATAISRPARPAHSVFPRTRRPPPRAWGLFPRTR